MFCYWVDAKATQGFARMQNAHVAEIVGRHPRRFVGMATVPLQAPALAIDELRHAREGLADRAGPDAPPLLPADRRQPARDRAASSTLIFGGVLELDRVVLGSDYPFDMGADDPVRAVESAELAPAARFLGLPAP